MPADAHEVAVVYTNISGSQALACRKTTCDKVHLLQPDADERYLVIVILNPNPFKVTVNGHDVVSLDYNPGKDMLKLSTHNIIAGANSVKESSFTCEAQPTQKLNKALNNKLAHVSNHRVSWHIYDGNDYDDLETEALQFQVEDDAQCEILA